MLNSKQKEAVEYMGGPMLILAGAGSGKTLTLVSRVSHLIEKGVEPSSILLLTFTNKAAGEMKERAVKMLDRRAEKVLACTFHSFCNKMLREYAEEIGLSKNYTIITPAEAQDAVRLLKAEHEDKNKNRPTMNNGDIVSLFSKHVNTGKDFPELLPKELRWFSEELEKLFNEYVRYKKSRDILDFDDLLLKFLDMLEKRDDIQKEVYSQYEHILVDEYQDTNKLQESILFKMNTKNLTVVGDDYQSLYAFRGADVENILSFPRRVSGCKVITLTENYRSSQEILTLANEVMSRHANFGYKKRMHGQYNSSIRPICITAENPHSEGEIVLSIIQKKIKEGLSPNEIAVLARTSYGTYPVEDLLVREGISYDKYGGPKFFEQASILDILAFLRCLANPIDQLAWFRILALYPGIGEKYARDIAGLCEKNNFLEENPHKNKKFYRELLGLKKQMLEYEGMNFSDMLANIIADYIILLTRCIEEGSYRTEDARNAAFLSVDTSIKPSLHQLYQIACNYESAVAFLDSLMLEQTKEEEKGEKLVVSTIHSIKGLEYKVVIVIGCADGIFPSKTKKHEGKESDMEELRCFYVALTRAKDELYITWPKVAMVGGRWRKLVRSHFLSGMENFMNCIENYTSGQNCPLQEFSDMVL